MFDLLRFVCEQLFGSSLYLSRECFDYLSTKLQRILIEFLQQTFSITHRSKRTYVLGEDFQTILKCRSISPLFGYCCSSTNNRKQLFQTIRQDGRILFVQTDKSIDLTNIKDLLRIDPIVIHVEWLAIDGEQREYRRNCSLVKNSILNLEQNLFLSELIQSNNFNPNVWKNLFFDDSMALNTILVPFIQWCRKNICECLQYSCRLQKRRQLSSYLIILDYLLQNSSNIIEHYLYVLTPMIINCLLYQFESKESLDFDENSPVDQGHIWYIRLLASRSCVRILQRSTSLLYDDFYIRIISRLICVLIDIHSPPSIIYAILRLFEQLGVHVCRRFLLSHLFEINSSQIHSSICINKILERIVEICNRKQTTV